jgi:type I restriction enzyme S subunit
MSNGNGRARLLPSPNDDSTDDLPTGWAARQLNDVATSRLGKMLDRGKNLAGGLLPYLRNVNVRWGEFDLEQLESMRFTPEESREFEIINGDVLVCEGGEPGRAAVWNNGATEIKFQKAIHRIRCGHAIDPKWLEFHFRYSAACGTLEELFTGTTIKHLTGVSLKRFVVKIPPLAEQQRIVAALEAIFAKVANCQARLANIPTILRRFRQSVLAAACSGRLTADWRDSNAHVADWQSKTLGDVFDVRTGGTPSRRNPAYFVGNIPWVKTSEVQNCDIFETEEHITNEAIANSNAKVFPAGTLLVALYGEGKTRGQIGCLRIDAATNQACAALINTKLTDVSRRYVFYYLLSVYYDLRARSAGGNQPNLSVGLVRNWPIEMPSIPEQQEIVRRVDALFAVADGLEARYQTARQHVDRLTQSVLSKAFRGELVPTEHALATAAGRPYEPASALLERIKSTAPTNGHTKPKPRRTKKR